GFDFAAIAFVFQCHILGMFAPSFFTGQLISRFGVKTFVWMGAICLVIANIVGLTGTSYAHFLVTMTLVGLAWNFILITTTHLLPQTYQENEKAKIQGATDFLIFSFGAIGSLIAGFAFYLMGWHSVNIFGLVVGASVIIIMIWLRNSLSTQHS
ncbi:MAG: MFS transporter, partial [Providencia rustigianii]